MLSPQKSCRCYGMVMRPPYVARLSPWSRVKRARTRPLLTIQRLILERLTVHSILSPLWEFSLAYCGSGLQDIEQQFTPSCRIKKVV